MQTLLWWWHTAEACHTNATVVVALEQPGESMFDQTKKEAVVALLAEWHEGVAQSGQGKHSLTWGSAIPGVSVVVYVRGVREFSRLRIHCPGRQQLPRLPRSTTAPASRQGFTAPKHSPLIPSSWAVPVASSQRSWMKGGAAGACPLVAPGRHPGRRRRAPGMRQRRPPP